MRGTGGAASAGQAGASVRTAHRSRADRARGFASISASPAGGQPAAAAAAEAPATASAEPAEPAATPEEDAEAAPTETTGDGKPA